MKIWVVPGGAAYDDTNQTVLPGDPMSESVLLKQKGYRRLEAAAKCAAMARCENPDLILMDVSVPEFEASKRWLQSERASSNVTAEPSGGAELLLRVDGK